MEDPKTKKKPRIFRVKCEYYIQVDDTDDAKDMAIDFVNNEIIDGRFEESHLIIDEVEDIDENEIYNHPKWSK